MKRAFKIAKTALGEMCGGIISDGFVVRHKKRSGESLQCPRTADYDVEGKKLCTIHASKEALMLLRDEERRSGEHSEQARNDGWEWAIVEIFGHRNHAGRTREEERFGTKMLRIDVPIKGDPAANGWETHWYGGSSIFSYTLTDEDSVMRSNKPWDAPARYRLPAPEVPDSDDEAEGSQDETAAC